MTFMGLSIDAMRRIAESALAETIAEVRKLSSIVFEATELSNSPEARALIATRVEAEAIKFAERCKQLLALFESHPELAPADDCRSLGEAAHELSAIVNLFVKDSRLKDKQHDH